MNKRQSVSLMVVLVLTSGSMVACDGVDEFEDSSLRASEEGLEFASWPPPELADVEEFRAGAVPPDVALPTGKVSPTDELVIGWNRWALALPWFEGPIGDKTGEKCGMGQEGPVWYLAGTGGGPVTRECDVPVGKQLFFPLVNRMSLFPPEYFPTEASIVKRIAEYTTWWYNHQYSNTCSLTLRIDGQEVLPGFSELDDELYIRILEPFEVDVNPAHWAPAYFDGGIMPATTDGHYALIQPLTPGDHVLEFGGSICGAYPFQTSATYLLHVE